MASKDATRNGADHDPLTQEQVVTAALAYIDANGLESFSMRNLARELGVYPTTLYWHAGNRDGLLSMAIGRALLEIEAPDDALPWDEWLSEFARRFRATLHLHPNVAPIVGTEMVSSAVTEFAIVEVILARLHHAGFRDDDLVDAYNVMFGCVIGFVSLELARLPEDSEWIDEMEVEIAQVRAEDYPVVAANAERMANKAFGMRWLPGPEVPLDRGFELMLRTVIGGLAANLSDP